MPPIKPAADHLAWCKRRALEYVDAGELANAVTSMLSDMQKHPETIDLVLPNSMRGLVLGSEGETELVRAWINGIGATPLPTIGGPGLFHVSWQDGKREPQEPPNPAYPEGIDVDASGGAPWTCVATLPYPAKRCGRYLVTCKLCQERVLVTTAGRADDPRSLRVACHRAPRPPDAAPPAR